MKETKPKILVVEDEEGIMLAVQENLAYAGYEVVTAADGPAGLQMGLEQKPNLIILDLMLPGMSGYDVCRKLRERGQSVPIIMLTARHDESDKLHGFEMGADDYVTKPFSMNELLARVKAVLARGARRGVEAQRLTFGDFVLDGGTRTLTCKGRDIPLTRTEFDLLAYFCTNEGKALSRETLMRDVWGTQYFGTQRSLDSFVASLRGKIEKSPRNPKHIQTVHGVGYKFLKE
jgi:DNA-binding response OmpR family regulator